MRLGGLGCVYGGRQMYYNYREMYRYLDIELDIELHLELHLDLYIDTSTSVHILTFVPPDMISAAVSIVKAPWRRVRQGTGVQVQDTALCRTGRAEQYREWGGRLLLHRPSRDI